MVQAQEKVLYNIGQVVSFLIQSAPVGFLSFFWESKRQAPCSGLNGPLWPTPPHLLRSDRVSNSCSCSLWYSHIRKMPGTLLLQALCSSCWTRLQSISVASSLPHLAAHSITSWPLDLKLLSLPLVHTVCFACSVSHHTFMIAFHIMYFSYSLVQYWFREGGSL